MADWNAIKNEYINSEISLRKLAGKYKIPVSTVARKCRLEGWFDEREHLLDNVSTRLAQETENSQVNRALAIYRSGDKLLEKANQLLDLEEALSPRDLKSISSTLLDLKMIHNIKDESEDAAEDTGITVRFVGNDWDQEEDNG